MPREKNLTTPPKRATRKKPVAKRSTPAVAHFVAHEQRAALIAEAAYFRAEKRGFAPGHDTEDWLQAEAEVDALLLRKSPAHPA